jgi:hypothetical protein
MLQLKPNKKRVPVFYEPEPQPEEPEQEFEEDQYDEYYEVPVEYEEPVEQQAPKKTKTENISRLAFGKTTKDSDHQATPRDLYDPLNAEFSKYIL